VPSEIKQVPRILAWLLVVVVVITAAALLVLPIERQGGATGELPPFGLQSRPQEGRYLFDYANLLGHFSEGVERYLDSIRQQYGIEALLVTVPDLGTAPSIQTLAVDLANGWRIGGEDGGRGLLLLLSAREQQARLEVGYRLEDVFTDAFVGYIEDLQLEPYFQRRDIGTGLVAVMEELERRAQIKHQGQYTAASIAGLDRQRISGGAGATRALRDYAATGAREDEIVEAGGAATPAEAWEIMLAKWSGRGEHIDKDIYTGMTRMAMGDPDHPDKRTRAAVKDWINADYEVLAEADHAVIWFGNREGWNYAPFLFCRTSTGWQFDIVHQRRLIVMAENPHWKVATGDNPYNRLLSGAKQSTGKDILLAPGDSYRCRDDAQVAATIQRLEQQYQQNALDFDTVMELARLGVITGRRPNLVLPYLDAAKALQPGSAEPYRYAAVYHINAYFQYETALGEVLELLRRAPDDLYGLLLEAFLHYRLGNYRQSIDSLEKARAIETDNIYALTLMARDYTLLNSRASKLDPRREGYADSARELLSRARKLAPESFRVEQLASWMGGWGLI
jgi:hypothetical protein